MSTWPPLTHQDVRLAIDELRSVAAFVSPDDGAAVIQAYIDAFAAAGGGSVVFAPGTYTANLIMKKGVTLKSERRMRGYLPGTIESSVKISAASGWVIDTVGGGTSTVGAAIEGIDIDGGGAATGGIRFQNADACAVRDVQLNNFVDQGLLCDSASGANVFEDILITNALMNRSRASNAGAVQIAGPDNQLSRIEASCSQSSLTSASRFNNAFYITGTNNFLNPGLVGEFADRGFYITGDQNKVTGTRADHNFAQGYEVTGGGNSFAAAQANDIGQATTNTYDGFLVSGTGNAFAACNVQAPGGIMPRYAFNDTVSNSTITSRNQWAGCRGAYGTRMFNVDGFLGSAPDIPAHPMRPADATATIDVTGTSFIVFQAYTTATTVTAFNNGVVGQRLYVLGDAQVTIQNNASIKTSTGANKTLADNRAYCFINYNGVWYEVGP